MSALPKQVRDQIEEANRIAAEIQASQQPPENDADTTQQPAGESSAAAQDVTFEADQNQTTTSTADQTPPDSSAAQPGASESEAAGQGGAPDTTDQAVGTPPVDGNDATFEQRWKSLQGINASLRQRNSELEGRVQGLENMMAQLQQMRREPQETEQPQSSAPAGLTPEEVENYGSDLISVIERKAEEVAHKKTEALRKENAELRQRLDGLGARETENAQQRLFSDLTKAVPNWRELNEDPAYLAWLRQIDPFAGRARMDLLREAFQASDATRVTHFFTTFVNEQAAVSKPAGASEPAPPKTNSGGNGKVDLATLASPGRGSGSADTPQSEVRQWKESEIGAFYDKVARGEYNGRDEEYRRIEAEIQAAVTGGHILVGA